jgi:mannose-1-phosphate guanylyltransferase
MYAVIMAGGSGTRFWPASRTGRPKQFLNVTGRSPLIMETCGRLASITADDHTVLILGRRHGPEVKRLFAGRPVHILLEPIGRNTAPCIGLGALYARYRGCEEAIAFLPADHFIGDEESFISALRDAASLAEKSGGLVALGIVPTKPEPGYGYIRKGKECDVGSGCTAYDVSAFVEKPDLQTAMDYVASGEFYWNAGIFVATPERILREMETHLPAFYQGLQEIEHALDGDEYETVLEEVYKRTEGFSFDYAVMEKTRSPVFVVPCDCGWSDVGSWEALYNLREEERDDQGNLSEGDVLLEGCKESFISARGERLVACLGLRNVLVVDTPDALLVADLEKSQDIRKIVNRLREKEKESVL